MIAMNTTENLKQYTSPLETLIVHQIAQLRSAEKSLSERYPSMTNEASVRDQFASELARLQAQADRLHRMMNTFGVNLVSELDGMPIMAPAAA